jgi:hypothetical protein
MIFALATGGLNKLLGPNDGRNRIRSPAAAAPLP